jgi:transposase-like protein
VRFWAECHGSDVNFICSKMHSIMFPADRCARRWRKTSGLFSLVRIFDNAPDRSTAEAYLARTVVKYADTASKLSAWMEENIPEGLTVFDFPRKWWLRLRTTNSLERVCQEIKRRTRVVRIFPNEASCLRLISAILMEIGEEWETGRVYLSFNAGLSDEYFRRE